VKNFKIAIIDSGLGGLSLFNTFLSELNVKNYVYFADIKNLPYGSKSKKELLQITNNNLKIIIKKYNPNAIVFGCNTIGTTIFNEVKSKFSYIPIFAIKPNLTNKQVLEQNRKTLIIATSATIEALENTKEYQENRNCIILCKMPKLASKIEDYIQNDIDLVPYISSKLCKFKNIDNIILGCTHYYFVKDIIAQLFPNAKLIDGTIDLVGQIKNSFKINRPKNRIKPHIRWFLTSNKGAKKQYKKILIKLTKNKNK
jgi:glutamate racemase